MAVDVSINNEKTFSRFEVSTFDGLAIDGYPIVRLP
jgi:hypothetical protein